MQYLIKQATRTVLLTAGLATLAACSSEIGVGSTFFKEAGAQIDSAGEFGAATLHNQLVQTCRTNSAAYSGKAGGGKGDPVVVLDPSSSVSRPVYRVHCNGQLDGKYALITYNQYVGSATREAAVEDADGGN